MSAAEHFDGIVIGAGQGGGPLSTALANAGWKMAMVERKHAGGTCINEGCTPTKVMVASARVAYLARRGQEYGVETGDIVVDFKKVRERKRNIVESWRKSSRNSIEGTDGLTYIDGEALFIAEKTLDIALNNGDTRQITGERIFINTGQRARTLPIDGLDDVSYLTNKSIMELDAVPDHLLVLGGGYIGLEFGQMYRRFGAEVTIIEAAPRFLPREDEDTAEAVAEILREDGITIAVGRQAQRIEQANDGDITLIAKTDDGEQTFSGDQLLLAVGRTPNTDMLNLEAAGVDVDERGYITVNDRLETNVPGIYALGDVKGGPAFTHISYDDFRVLRANLIEDGDVTIRDRLVPYTVFIDPQLAHVGLHEDQARDAGYDIRVAKLPMAHVARAIEMDETRGFMKAIVDADTDQILGATVLGVEGGEVMAVLQMAMVGSVPYPTIRDGVFAHPTLAESLNNLFMALDED